MQILWIQKDFPFVADFSGYYMSPQYYKMPFAERSHGLRKVVLIEMWLKVSMQRWEENELKSIKVQILLLAPLEKYVL